MLNLVLLMNTDSSAPGFPEHLLFLLGPIKIKESALDDVTTQRFESYEYL